MASSLPWPWIIETLADCKQVDSHLLQVLMRSAPDFSIDSCEIARERVSLRILEEILDLIPANASDSLEVGDAPSISGQSFWIDVSERAVDVLIKATSSDLTHGAAWKHALTQFILQKRACLPKNALEQLKELILEHGHPSATSLRERSGLAKENKAYCLDNNRIPADSVGEHETAKSLEVSNNTGEILTLEQNLPTVVLENGNKSLQEDAHTRISRSKLDEKEREPLLGDKVTNNNDNAQSIKQTTLPPDGSATMPLEAQLNGALKTMHHCQDIRQNICVDETEDGGEAPEIFSRSCEGQNTDLNYDLNDEMVAAEKHWFISSQNTVSNNSQAEDCTEQSFCIKCDKGGELLICSGSRCPIAVHECCLGSPVSFEDTNNFYCPFCSYTRANAAYRKAKQKIAIARKALSSFMGRDLVHPIQRKQLPARVPGKPCEAARNANCPVKIHANQQHREIIDNHICKRVVEIQQQEKTSTWSNSNLPCREEVTSLINERNGVSLIQRREGTVTTVGDNQCITAVEHRHQVDVATVCSNGNLPCKEVDTSIIEGHDVSSIEAERNCVEILKDNQCIREVEHQQQPEPPTVCNDGNFPCREAETFLNSETHNVINGKGDNAEMVNNHQCINGSTHQKQAETGTDCITGNTPRIEAEASLTAERHARGKRKSAVIQQTSDPEDPARLRKTDAEKTARNQNEEDFSPNKSIKRQRPAKRYSNPLLPHARRTKLLWNTEEEEMLKEAVQKFSNPGQGSLPWTKILEFGSNVFHRTRTPIDLKDKWRNIMIKEGKKVT